MAISDIQLYQYLFILYIHSNCHLRIWGTISILVIHDGNSDDMTHWHVTDVTLSLTLFALSEASHSSEWLTSLSFSIETDCYLLLSETPPDLLLCNGKILQRLE